MQHPARCFLIRLLGSDPDKSLKKNTHTHINMQNALLEIRVPQSHLSLGAHSGLGEKWWAHCNAIRNKCVIVNAINGSLSGVNVAPQTAGFWMQVCAGRQHSALGSGSRRHFAILRTKVRET